MRMTIPPAGRLGTADSFFFLIAAEQPAELARFAAHLEPGGALLFTSGPRAGQRIGWFEGEPLFHASLAPAAYRRCLRAAGCRLFAHRA